MLTHIKSTGAILVNEPVAFAYFPLLLVRKE